MESAASTAQAQAHAARQEHDGELAALRAEADSARSVRTRASMPRHFGS